MQLNGHRFVILLIIPSMTKIRNFFWFCSGASFLILKRCPTESSRFVSIGGAVFFTGLLAAVSAGFALYTVFDSHYAAIGFGLLWGLMIFNLDRFLVSSLKRKDKKWQEWLVATPRLVLAVLIAIVIAKPLELQIFSPEIAAELSIIREEQLAREQGMISQRYEKVRGFYEKEINQLELQIAGKELQRDELVRIAQEEADGTGGSLQRNLGPIYKVKEANAEKAEMELQELKKVNLGLIGLHRQRMDSVLQSETQALAAIDVSGMGGLALQMEALKRLANKFPAIAFANLFIVLLFIMIEASPILVKLMSPSGPYDELLEAHEHAFVTFRKARVHQLDSDLASKLAGKVDYST